MADYNKSFKFFSFLLRPFMKLRFGYTCDSLSEIEGPFLLLCNHNTDLDPIFLGIAADQDLCFVASEHIMRKGLGTKFLVKFFNPIAHTKGKLGLKTSAAMLRALRDDKRSVALFPEGNRSFNGITCEIPKVTGKLARTSGVKLVTYRLEGGYLTQPRWGCNFRKGRLTGRLVRVYEAEELKKMKPAQIQECIEQDLHADAFEEQRKLPVKYKGKDIALGLESAIFCCPSCKKIGGLHTHDNMLECECGYSAEFTETGFLKDVNNNEVSVNQLDTMQKEHLAQLLASSEESSEPLFSDRMTAQLIGDDHEVIRTVEGTLSASPLGFTFNDKFFAPEAIEGMAIHSRNTITAHIAETNEQYEIKGEKFSNALKYLYLFNMLKENSQTAEEA